MKNLNFLIKPASGLCNMRCRYCFYEEEVSARENGAGGVMSPETAEELIRGAFNAAQKGSEVSFAFQGGEPTLAGLPFFYAFTELVKKYNAMHIPVHYAIQTNGLCLSPEWAGFFKRENFLTGISLDGSQAIHDALRPDANGGATWERIRENLILLQDAQVDVNILTVVTKRLAKHPERIYRSLKETGVSHLQFIPCLDPMGSPRGKQAWSLSPDDYGHFLCGLFDAWYEDWTAGRYVSVRLFDDYIYLAMGQPAGTCSTSGSCGAYLVVESDGSVYPCDFYCLDSWKLGNIRDSAPRELLRSEKEQAFLREGMVHPAECARCRWRRLCFGGCRRDWIYDETGTHHYYCSSFWRFFTYASDRIFRIAAEQRRG